MLTFAIEIDKEIDKKVYILLFSMQRRNPYSDLGLVIALSVFICILVKCLLFGFMVFQLTSLQLKPLDFSALFPLQFTRNMIGWVPSARVLLVLRTNLIVAFSVFITFVLLQTKDNSVHAVVHATKVQNII